MVLLPCRSLYWERGLKLPIYKQWQFESESLPVLGAWIEITTLLEYSIIDLVAPCIGSVDWNNCDCIAVVHDFSRSLYWERGLKLSNAYVNMEAVGRSLYWERGLKSTPWYHWLKDYLSLPVLGAWIEMPNYCRCYINQKVAPCIGSVDWN